MSSLSVRRPYKGRMSRPNVERRAVTGLAIKDVAARTGIAAGTIRMWEQRYGFPEPQRTSAGYRVYSEDDVEALRRVLAYRERGLSVPAAVDRARSSDLATDRPSLYGVLAAGDSPPPAQLLCKRTLIAVSRAIEEETISRAASPVVIGAFQQRAQLPRGRAPLPRAGADRRRRGGVRRLRRARRGRRRAGRGADVARRRARQRVGGRGRRARATPPACSRGSGPARAEVPDLERRFEAMWTLDPRAARRAARGRGHAGRRGRTPRSASGSMACWPSGRWRSSSRRRR